MPEPGPGEIRLQIEAVGFEPFRRTYVRGTYVDQPRLPSRARISGGGNCELGRRRGNSSLMGKRLSSIPGFSMNDYGVFSEQAILPHPRPDRGSR